MENNDLINEDNILYMLSLNASQGSKKTSILEIFRKSNTFKKHRRLKPYITRSVCSEKIPFHMLACRILVFYLITVSLISMMCTRGSHTRSMEKKSADRPSG